MSALPPICVEVGHRSGTYPILIQDGMIGAAETILRSLAGTGRLFAVSDEQVWPLHGGALAASLEAAGQRADPILLTPGEASKSWKGLRRLVDGLLQAGIERGDHVLALGGGVVGDVAGFAAAIVKRGCGFIQMPTTLLAQVDSSIGGKTGINVAAGKNLVGTFYQPKAVLIDPACLDSLPARQLRAGYAEIVKYGLIQDAEFFAWCERRGQAFLDGDKGARAFAIKASVEAKAAFVTADETETGDRALLNLGHTFAHALEAETGFSDALLHGEAVSIGLALAFRFSAGRGLCDTADADRVAAHLASIGLPTALGQVDHNFEAERLVARMRHDKKAAAGRTAFILARGIGEAFVDRSVELDEVAAFLRGEIALT